MPFEEAEAKGVRSLEGAVARAMTSNKAMAGSQRVVFRQGGSEAPCYGERRRRRLQEPGWTLDGESGAWEQ